MPSQNVLEDLVKRIENGTLRFLEEDSEFVVDCEQCGKCCRDREDILLSPHDIYHMVKATKMPVLEMLQKYTEVYLGPNSNLPIVRIVYRQESNGSTTCPFLGRKDDKYYCRIHDNKPYVCRSYPLGRMTSFIANGNKKSETDYPRYFEQPQYGPLCQGMANAVKNNTKHTVLDWVGGKEKKDAADKYWVLFNRFTSKLSETINLKELFNLKNEQLKKTCFSMMAQLLYMDYDFETDENGFLEQYERNTNKIIEYMDILAMHPNGKLRPKKKKDSA